MVSSVTLQVAARLRAPADSCRNRAAPGSPAPGRCVPCDIDICSACRRRVRRGAQPRRRRELVGDDGAGLVGEVDAFELQRDIGDRVPAPASRKRAFDRTLPSPVMSAGSSNQGAANLRSAETVVVAGDAFHLPASSSSRPSRLAVVPAILSPLPLNVVTPVSLRISARDLHVERPVGPPRAVSCPASQPKRGSAITGRSHTSARSVNLADRVGQRDARAPCSVTRVCLSESRSSRTLAPFDRDAGDGQFAHFEHDGVDRARAGRQAH